MLTMKTSSNRSGYSLPEVLVATVLLGIVGGALTKLIVTQMRFFDNVSAVRGARSVARNSVDIILSDLRMVQDTNGVAAASASSVTLRVPYRFGVLCGSTGSLSTVAMLPADSAVLAFAKYAGYGWRNRTTGLYTLDSTGTAPVAAASDSTKCTTDASVKSVSITGRAGAFLDLSPAIASTVTVGSPVFLWQKITYNFAASNLFPGKMALWRTVAGGVSEELMAPFDASSGFKFYTVGADSPTTSVPTKSLIRGIGLVLNAVGSRTPAGRTSPPQQKMTTAVFFKNIH